jgi:hypothetical protein
MMALMMADGFVVVGALAHIVGPALFSSELELSSE